MRWSWSAAPRRAAPWSSSTAARMPRRRSATSCEQGTCDEILLSTPPEHHPHWHRHGLPEQIQALGIPVTVIPPDPTGWSYAHGFPDDWVRTEVGPLT